jgi:hypothetical protein
MKKARIIFSQTRKRFSLLSPVDRRQSRTLTRLSMQELPLDLLAMMIRPHRLRESMHAWSSLDWAGARGACNSGFPWSLYLSEKWVSLKNNGSNF